MPIQTAKAEFISAASTPPLCACEADIVIAKAPTPLSLWSERYAQRHRLVRICVIPGGIAAPKRVRIYSRGAYHMLQFWDPSVKRTLYRRVEGDLIDALGEARRIDQRLNNCRSSGQVGRRVNHQDLVEQFTEDLKCRANAGTIAPATVQRYRSALGHYLAFVQQPQMSARYPLAMRVDRSLAMEFSAFLGARLITPNGRSHIKQVKMRGQDFVLDAVRAMFDWAADAERGNLLPAGFRNPFLRNVLERRRAAKDMASDPDITVPMIAAFLNACDQWQLRLFSPIVFYGLRPSELIYLFHESLTEQFLDVACVQSLGHMTKGRRNKRLPMFPQMYRLLLSSQSPGQQGLIFNRRELSSSKNQQLVSSSLAAITTEFERRCRVSPVQDAAAIQHIRQQLMSEAGALSYKMIQCEFTRVAQSLNWPRTATLKDFRHACNTALANGGMPEHERRYLLGHHPGRGAIVVYTHLNKLTEHYVSACECELAPALEVLRQRVK